MADTEQVPAGTAVGPERWYALSPDEVAERLGVAPASGLTAATATQRLQTDGPNALRSLVAEPFLVVGIIASIKEIIVASLALADASGSEFDEGVQKVGVLGVVVLLLALSSFLVRRKEREPAET